LKAKVENTLDKWTEVPDLGIHQVFCADHNRHRVQALAYIKFRAYNTSSSRPTIHNVQETKETVTWCLRPTIHQVQGLQYIKFKAYNT